jgi:hypothetical protein
MMTPIQQIKLQARGTGNTERLHSACSILGLHCQPRFLQTFCKTHCNNEMRVQGLLYHVAQEKVIGQTDAVGAVARAMRRARSGLKDPARPIAAMLFAGPTGVGKTELTKVRSPE